MKDKIFQFFITTKLGRFLFMFLGSVLFNLFLLTISFIAFKSAIIGCFFTAFFITVTDRKCKNWI